MRSLVSKARTFLYKIFSVVIWTDTSNNALPSIWLLSPSPQAPNILVSNTFKIKNTSSVNLTGCKITIHDNFEHDTLPSSGGALATGNTESSVGTWTTIGYLAGYSYLGLGTINAGSSVTIQIRTQIAAAGDYFARLHFEGTRDGISIHSDQMVGISYKVIQALKRPGELKVRIL